MEIRVFEGFEMVGKTSSIERIKNKSKNATVLVDFKDKFGYGDNKYGIDHKKSWVIGASWFHLLNELKDVVPSDHLIIIDRGLLSSVVYTMMTNVGQAGSTHTGYLMSDMITDYKKLGASIHYLYHDDMNVARKMYECATTSNRVGSDKFDKYESFEHYWDTYLDYHERFSVISDLLTTMGIAVEKVGTSKLWEDLYV
jgi:thymidylate kinase